MTDIVAVGKRENLELEREAVYRWDPGGTLTRVVDSLTRPNGILVSADGKTLYVAENASPGGAVQLWAFDLDGRGDSSIATGIGFLDHMLDLFARHGLFDLEVSCAGDLHIDGHHSVEDIAITLGQAVFPRGARSGGGDPFAQQHSG